MTKLFHGLYAIVDADFSKKIAIPCEDLARDYLEGGVPILQLRDKGRKKSESHFEGFRKTAEKIASLKKDYDFIFILNDEVAVARSVGADGVHVGQEDPSIEECRSQLGFSKWIGYSSHSVEEALEAEKKGANYVAFGAVYPTTSKNVEHPIQGIQKLKDVIASVTVPVVAIGGIGRKNLQEVRMTGVECVAMISALAEGRNREERIETVRFFVQAMTMR